MIVAVTLNPSLDRTLLVGEGRRSRPPHLTPSALPRARTARQVPSGMRTWSVECPQPWGKYRYAYAVGMWSPPMHA
jgi:hypothetical protein